MTRWLPPWPWVPSLLMLLASTARAEVAPSYGVAAGTAVPLAPAERPGVAAGLSAVVRSLDLDEKIPTAMLHVRGEVLGLYVPEETWAVMPLLSTDFGVELGPVQLFASGGVQLFGFARRAGYTVFATLGLLGGGGVAVRLHPRVQIDLRALVCWLPNATAGVMSKPSTDSERPTLLFAAGLLGVILTL